jgi:hypothetical protein
MYAVYGCQVHLNEGILVGGIVSLKERFDQPKQTTIIISHPSSPAIGILSPLIFLYVVLLEGKS